MYRHMLHLTNMIENYWELPKYLIQEKYLKHFV